jgi:hypothetical protein
MEPSTRTPEGDPNRCPVCGKSLQIEPSRPPGDAPCPHCGTLLWFEAGIHTAIDPKRKPLDPFFLIAEDCCKHGEYETAAGMLAFCIQRDPGNAMYAQNFMDANRRNAANEHNARYTTRIKSKEAELRRLVDEAIASRDSLAVITNCIPILWAYPFDVSTLKKLIWAYKHIASEGKGQPYSRFADCARFYEECAAKIEP